MAWHLDDVVVLSFSSIAKVFAMTFLLPLDALIYTVPVIAQIIATITWPEVVNNAIIALFILALVVMGIWLFFSEP